MGLLPYKGNNEMSETNPNGSNQFKLDPRQNLCWELYVTPGSETFGNALQSAIRAGYSKATAKTIKNSPWFSEKLQRLDLLQKGEKVLAYTLTMPHEVPAMGTLGPIKDKEGRAVMKIDSALLRIKLDSAKFVAERLGKAHYSTRAELVGKDGEALLPTPLLDGVRKTTV